MMLVYFKQGYSMLITINQMFIHWSRDSDKHQTILKNPEKPIIKVFSHNQS